MSLRRPRTYDEQRIAWRKSLPEMVVRQLASDYDRGVDLSECAYDAYLEYMDRFAHQSKGPSGARMPLSHDHRKRS